MQYQDFVTTTKSVPLSLSSLPVDKSYRAHVLTHRSSWGEGMVTRYGLPDVFVSPTVCLQTPSTLIQGGTSGGPVVDDKGKLIGVVSNTGGAEGDTEHRGSLSIAHLALPRWILDQVLAVQKPRTRRTAGPTGH